MKLRTYAILIAAALIIIVLVALAPNIKTQLNAWKLLPQPERLTELYFTAPNNLPTTYVPGQSQTVSFTVHNLEYRTATYNYVITEASLDNTTSQILAHGTFTLAQDQFKKEQLNITLTDIGHRIKVKVDLQGRNESIGYLLLKEGV